jgi:hypothetical protein
MEIIYIIGDVHIGRSKISNYTKVNKFYQPFIDGKYSSNFRDFHIQKSIERFQNDILKDILRIYTDDSLKYKTKNFKIILLGDFLDNPSKDLNLLEKQNPKLKEKLTFEFFGKLKKLSETLDIPVKFYYLFGNHELLYGLDKNIKRTMKFLTDDIIKKYNFLPSEFEIIHEKKYIFFDYSPLSKTLYVFIPFISNVLNDVRRILYLELKKRFSNLSKELKNEIKNVFIFTHNNIFVNERWFNKLTISFAELEKHLLNLEELKNDYFPNLENCKLFNGHIHKYWLENNLNCVGSFFPFFYKEDLQALGLYKLILSEEGEILNENGIYNTYSMFVKHLPNSQYDKEKFVEYMLKLEFENRKRYKENKHILSTIVYSGFDLENIIISKTEKYNLLRECSHTIAYYQNEEVVSNFEELKIF